MKLIFVVLIILFILGCNNLDDLNNRIYEAQKEAVAESPYKSAKGAMVYINAQKDFRVTILPKLIKQKFNLTEALKDTIYTVEIFDETCINCSSEWMKILLKDSLYIISEEILSHKGKVRYEINAQRFDLDSNDFQYKMNQSELIETVAKIKKGKPWRTNPLEYGTDYCNDGGHTIVTAIYPNKKIEAMYVRCWMPAFFKNKK